MFINIQKNKENSIGKRRMGEIRVKWFWGCSPGIQPNAEIVNGISKEI